MFQSPCQQPDLQRLPAYHPLQRCDLGLVFLHQVGRLYVIIGGSGLKLADPDPDQLPRDVMPLRQPVQRLAPDELFRDLPLERGPV